MATITVEQLDAVATKIVEMVNAMIADELENLGFPDAEPLSSAQQGEIDRVILGHLWRQTK